MRATHSSSFLSLICAALLKATVGMASLRLGLRVLLPLPSSMLCRFPRRSSFLPLPPLPLRLDPVFSFRSLRFDSPPLPLFFQVRCSGSLKAKGKPRGPLWRQRKGVSKEALQVVFELKRCQADKLQERAVLRNSAARLLKMDLLMVLVELRRQEECSLAMQVFNMVRKEEWYKPDIFLYREMIDTLGKNKLIEDVEQLYAEMQEEGIAPNAMILTELMGAYIRNDNVARAYEVFERIKQGELEPEYIMYEILCRGLKKVGDFEKLKVVMEDCSEAFPDSPPPFSRMIMERGL